jgi:predicted  nucleic acid-binding Zn-ribbon protein
MLRRENDKQTGEVFELRKEIDYHSVRNADLNTQIRDLEFRVKDKDDQIYAMRKDLDSQKYQNSQFRDSNLDFLSEKEALEKHAAVL